MSDQYKRCIVISNTLYELSIISLKIKQHKFTSRNSLVNGLEVM